MEMLKKFGQLCQQQYEKIILCLVLAGLAVAVLYLYDASQKEEEKIKEFLTDIGRRKENPVKPAEAAHYNALIQQAQNPSALEFAGAHNLFNPVRWQRNMKDGTMIKSIKGTEVDNIVITDIRPLNFTIAFDRVAGPGYWINITNQVAIVPSQRRLAQYATAGSTNTKVFILREVKGTPEEPTELVLELKETGERVSVAKEKPFIRAEAYEADLKSTIEPKTYTKQRVGMNVRFQDMDYKVVAINQNEVVLFAPNEKKYPIPYKPGP
jgi:hypothetical protein